MELVQAIYLCPPEIPFEYNKVKSKSLPPYEVEQAYARKDMGLEGDRFFGISKSGNVSFLAIEHVQNVVNSMNISPMDFRRNILTSGIDIPGLIGKTFKIGNVYFYGERLCGFCPKLKLNIKKYIDGCVDKDKMGITARVINDGIIKKNDRIVVIKQFL